jgi:hypothetical protein
LDVLDEELVASAAILYHFVNKKTKQLFLLPMAFETNRGNAINNSVCVPFYVELR